jgi:hypothetical protein
MPTNTEAMEELIELLEGHASDQEAQRILARVATDPSWSAAYTWLSDFLAMANRTSLVSPPPSTRAVLDDLIPQRHPLSDALDRFAEAVGRLVRDVRAGPAFAGARGTALDAKRHLLFDVGDGDELALQLHTTAATLFVSGQILSDRPSRLIRMVGDESTIDVSTDEFGEFAASTAITSFLLLEIVDGQRTTALDMTPFLDHASESGVTTAPSKPENKA